MHALAEFLTLVLPPCRSVLAQCPLDSQLGELKLKKRELMMMGEPEPAPVPGGEAGGAAEEAGGADPAGAQEGQGDGTEGGGGGGGDDGDDGDGDGDGEVDEASLLLPLSAPHLFTVGAGATSTAGAAESRPVVNLGHGHVASEGCAVALELMRKVCGD